MVSSNFSRFLPWEDRPARKFPAQRWVEERFGFRLPPLHLRPRLRLGERDFPAKTWLEQRQARSG